MITHFYSDNRKMKNLNENDTTKWYTYIVPQSLKLEPVILQVVFVLMKSIQIPTHEMN